MKPSFWIGLLSGAVLVGIIWIGSNRYQAIVYSNRTLTHLLHPMTGDQITILVLGGISNDVIYLIHGYYQSLDVPSEKDCIKMGDEIGITYSDSTRTVYYVGKPSEYATKADNRIVFMQLTPKSYNDLMKEGKVHFLYRGVF